MYTERNLTPCESCPVGAACIKLKTQHETYCNWAKSGDPAKLAKIVELSREGLPSVVNQVKSAIGAAVDFIACGCQLASKEEVDRRMNICGSCEFFKDERCQKCGCFMKVKVLAQSSVCPVAKW